MTLACRLLEPGEAAVLAQVAPDVFDAPVDPGRAAAFLEEPGHFMAVALDGPLVVGQCAAILHRRPDRPPELYIDNLGVAPPWQRRGLARRMLRLVMDRGRARGCEEAWVGTEPDNEATNAFYQALGSEPETFRLHLFRLGDPA